MPISLQFKHISDPAEIMQLKKKQIVEAMGQTIQTSKFLENN